MPQRSISPQFPLAKPVQEAVLRLLMWNSRYRMIDHGYDMSADLRIVLEQFTLVVHGPRPSAEPDQTNVLE